MPSYLDEVDNNFANFRTNCKNEVERVSSNLENNLSDYKESYRRIVSLQSWRSSFLENEINEGSLAFFLEAQNDALVSHVLAGVGSWRVALQSLRGCIENVFFCLYYMDHPVELKLWEEGKDRLDFRVVFSYMTRHPQFISVENKTVKGLDIIDREYATLSRSVHGSAVSFRMTDSGGFTRLWSDTKSDLKKWLKRESLTIYGLNLILMTMFRGALQGAGLPSLRNAISLAVSATKYPLIRRHLKIHLKTSDS